MKTFFAAALFATALAGISSAGAMPLAPAASPNADSVIHVAQGCGPGFHRGPMGACRPNGVIIGRPIVRACPPGFFMGPRGGCRRRYY